MNKQILKPILILSSVALAGSCAYSIFHSHKKDYESCYFCGLGTVSFFAAGMIVALTYFYCQ